MLPQGGCRCHGLSLPGVEVSQALWPEQTIFRCSNFCSWKVYDFTGCPSVATHSLGDGAPSDNTCWMPLQELQGAEVRFGSVSNEESLAQAAFSDPVDVVVSCLASRTGGKVTHCPLTHLSRSGGR